VSTRSINIALVRRLRRDLAPHGAWLTLSRAPSLAKSRARMCAPRCRNIVRSRRRRGRARMRSAPRDPRCIRESRGRSGNPRDPVRPVSWSISTTLATALNFPEQCSPPASSATTEPCLRWCCRIETNRLGHFDVVQVAVRRGGTAGARGAERSQRNSCDQRAMAPLN